MTVINNSALTDANNRLVDLQSRILPALEKVEKGVDAEAYNKLILLHENFNKQLYDVFNELDIFVPEVHALNEKQAKINQMLQASTQRLATQRGDVGSFSDNKGGSLDAWLNS